MPIMPTVLLTRPRLVVIVPYASLNEPPITGTSVLTTSFAPLTATVSAVLARIPFIDNTPTNNEDVMPSTLVVVVLISAAISLSFS
ncbi:hypothetical protein SDC9_140188 [bioreactor metagenome]|uniref:Uncharacterized protein n=1 Tax=bioreactor metagenome TaxID=1076179 RepID=A0A645DXJ7_9ZZZZ